EFEAILKRFPDATDEPTGPFRRQYAFRKVRAAGSDICTLAIVRCVSQGLAEGQNVANDIIEDLQPRLILVVGISGAPPSTDLFLGDVLLATHIHDYSLGADTQEGRELALSGSSPPKNILTAIAALAAKKAQLGNWNSAHDIGIVRPGVPL